MLIKSELFEAFEALRGGSKLETWSAEYLDGLLKMSEELTGHFTFEFRDIVKDSYPDELADMFIRLCDFIGYKKIQIFEEHKEKLPYDNIFDNLIYLDCCLTRLYDQKGVFNSKVFFYILSTIEGIASSCEIELETHIKLKLAYNKTREKRHGNKKI